MAVSWSWLQCRFDLASAVYNAVLLPFLTSSLRLTAAHLCYLLIPNWFSTPGLFYSPLCPTDPRDLSTSSLSLEEEHPSWHSRSPGCTRIITPRGHLWAVPPPSFPQTPPKLLIHACWRFCPMQRRRVGPAQHIPRMHTGYRKSRRRPVPHITRLELELHHSPTSASRREDPQRSRRRRRRRRPRILLRLVLVLGRRHRINRTVLLLLLLIIRTELVPAASITRKGRIAGRR